MLIGIVGAGPAGCALAGFLAQRGIECIVFDDDKRPDLLVGESLIPAVMPYLQRLGIDAAVAEISEKKYGAAIRHPNGQRMDFAFQAINSQVPNYAYNIPRPAFDKLLRSRAEILGAQFVQQRAVLEKTVNDNSREIQLTDASLDAAGLKRHPDLLIDASGRHRLFSRILSLPTRHGQRDDVAIFAHYENFATDTVLPGQVVISVLECGWSWQIPLKNTLSVGVVVDKNVVRSYGETPEQRLEAIIDSSSLLSVNGLGRHRVSAVMSYSNYQLISEKTFGRGWVLLGDAFGFVDPMLSPGVFMALESAALLDKHVFSRGSFAMKGLDAYSDAINHWHLAWDQLINYLYDGRFLGLIEAGNAVARNSKSWSPARVLEWYVRRTISSMVSGVSTRSSFKQQVLLQSCKYLLKDSKPLSEYSIKAARSTKIFSEVSSERVVSLS
jgi:flavin-dependent dehydrogenase